LSDRANLIARWVLESPPPNAVSSAGEGPRKRRKKPAKRAADTRGSSTDLGLKGEGDGHPDMEGEGEADCGAESPASVVAGGLGLC
jgi:hypothetical protein